MAKCHWYNRIVKGISQYRFNRIVTNAFSFWSIFFGDIIKPLKQMQSCPKEVVCFWKLDQILFLISKNITTQRLSTECAALEAIFRLVFSKNVFIDFLDVLKRNTQNNNTYNRHAYTHTHIRVWLCCILLVRFWWTLLNYLQWGKSLIYIVWDIDST